LNNVLRCTVLVLVNINPVMEMLIFKINIIKRLNYLSKAFVKICACLADLSYSNLSDNAATCMSNMIRKIRKD